MKLNKIKYLIYLSVYLLFIFFIYLFNTPPFQFIKLKLDSFSEYKS